MIIIIFCSFLCSACPTYGLFQLEFNNSNVDERSSSLSNFGRLDLSSQVPELSSIYSFLVFSDSHFGSERQELDESKILDWLNSWFQKYADGETKDLTKLPRFAVNLGDTADSGKEEQFKQYLFFENKIKKVAGKYLYSETDETSDAQRQFQVWSILGNHDLYNDGAKYFEKLIFPYMSAYYFNFDADSSDSYSGFSFYFLDSANGSMGANQIEDFKKKLDSDSRPKIVFTHYPVYAGGSDKFMIIQDTMERNLLLTYFKNGSVKQVYEGHAHKNYGFDFNVFKEDVIGSIRFSGRDEKQCAVVTVNEKAGTVSTEIIRF
ncbi:metallophosphoesterase family protein [Treponema sp.]|uniref:metallophosphoesterase family protein n=1 Tax=Treponema sp. TaxID=166 RepID=UPI00388D15DF